MTAATMPHIPPTASLQIQPGEALGPLSLSSSLFSTITTLLQHKSTFPRLNISFNSTNPVTNPIYVHLETNGLRLQFDGESQHLELIQVTEFGRLGLVYADTNLSRHGPPSFRSVYKTFGPTSPGELVPATPASPQMYILSYPGIAFKFPVPSNAPSSPSDKELLNLLHKTDPACLASSVVIFPGGSWTEARSTLDQVKSRAGQKKRTTNDHKPTDDDDPIECAEIIPNEKIELLFESGKTVSLSYGVFTAQDAITLLGPPSEVYTKSDTRLNIHNSHSRNDEIDQGPLSEASEYFYNYFPHGLSLLFSPTKTHTLQKVLLHANLPQSHAFHRFNRLRWTLSASSASPPSQKDTTTEVVQLTSETNFEEIKATLEKTSGPTGPPMIVNRGGQGSPSSSVELVSDDLLTASPFGCTGFTPQPPHFSESLTDQSYLGLLRRGWYLRLLRGDG